MSETETPAEVASEAAAEKAELITFAEFLESTPPGQLIEVADLVEFRDHGPELARPEIQLHCTSDQCNGVRVFRRDTVRIQLGGKTQQIFLTYVCSNCRSSRKTFALHLQREETFSHGGPSSSLERTPPMVHQPQIACLGFSAPTESFF